MRHAILISPSSNLPTIVSENSKDYAELMFMGYTPLQFGTLKELQSIEEEMMQDFAMELDISSEIN